MASAEVELAIPPKFALTRRANLPNFAQVEQHEIVLEHSPWKSPNKSFTRKTSLPPISKWRAVSCSAERISTTASSSAT